MTRPIRTRKSAKDRKLEIVETAIRLSGDLGPDRLTTQRLAEEIGITQPAIFRHFPSKGDIWLAVAKHIAVFMEPSAGMSAPGAAKTLPEGQLQKMVENHLRFIQTTPAIPAILFSTELHGENEELRQFFVQLMKNRQQMFATLIRGEIAAGRIAKDLNAEDVAYLILALVQGLAMRWSMNGREFDLVEEGRRLLTLQFAGFRPAP